MKIAIVTGASSGMGREMVYELADRFAALEEIWVIARRKERLDEFDGRLPVKCRKFVLDLSRQEDRIKLSEALEEIRPEVKILVNAAGFGATGAVGTVSEQESIGMIRLNCINMAFQGVF